MKTNGNMLIACRWKKEHLQGRNGTYGEIVKYLKLSATDLPASVYLMRMVTNQGKTVISDKVFIGN